MSKKIDIYQTVTDKIVAAIESDPGDWTRPWVSVGGGRPYNAVTDARYNGVNVLLLGLTTHAMAYKAWVVKLSNRPPPNSCGAIRTFGTPIRPTPRLWRLFALLTISASP